MLFYVLGGDREGATRFGRASQNPAALPNAFHQLVKVALLHGSSSSTTSATCRVLQPRDRVGNSRPEDSPTAREREMRYPRTTIAVLWLLWWVFGTLVFCVYATTPRVNKLQSAGSAQSAKTIIDGWEASGQTATARKNITFDYLSVVTF